MPPRRQSKGARKCKKAEIDAGYSDRVTEMKRLSDQFLLSINTVEFDPEEQRKRVDNKGAVAVNKDKESLGEDEYQDDDVVRQFKCMLPFHRPSSSRRGSSINSSKKRDDSDAVSEAFSWENSSVWGKEQRTLQKRVKARWALEELIDEHMSRFHDYFKRAMAPTSLTGVTQLLMPEGAAPQQLATLTWLGDWRPSAILDLLCSLANSSPRLSSLLLDCSGVEGVLLKLIHELRIEEAVIDEEMAEIQATCVLHLPFSPLMSSRSNGPVLKSVQAEFKKIHRVIAKAQNLRFKALELVVKKVLSQTDAAEFLVAFEGIQDLIQHLAMQHKLRKGPVSFPRKALHCCRRKLKLNRRHLKALENI